MDKTRAPLHFAAAACGLVLALAWVPAGAQRPSMQMLGRLDAGRWELRPRDGSMPRQICLGEDRRRLVQVRHPGLACDRMVLEDRPDALTVQYTCRGRGYGRTHLRRETSQLIQIETQGIADGLPFELAAEGRRIGDCSS